MLDELGVDLKPILGERRIHKIVKIVLKIFDPLILLPLLTIQGKIVNYFMY